MSESEILERLERLESYIDYKTWYLVENDHMTRQDLAQEARKAVVTTLKSGNHYPNAYLRKVASSAMSQYLRKGRSVDRPWNHYGRGRGHQICSLDEPKGDGPSRHETDFCRRGWFQDAADARIMLDQLESYLSSGQRLVVYLLRQGYRQVDISEMLDLASSQIYHTTRSIRETAREIWHVRTPERQAR